MNQRRKILLGAIFVIILLLTISIFYYFVHSPEDIADKSLKCNQLYELRKAQGNIAGSGDTNPPNYVYIVYNPALNTCEGLFMYGPDAIGTNYNIVDLNTSEQLLDYSSFPSGFAFADPKCQFESQSLMYVENGKKTVRNICGGNDLMNQAISKIRDFGFKNFNTR